LGRLLKELNTRRSGLFWDFFNPKRYELVQGKVCKRVIFWSDECAPQYKSKVPFLILVKTITSLKELLGIFMEVGELMANQL